MRRGQRSTGRVADGGPVVTAARIIVLGSLNMDLVVGVSHFPAPGETISAHSWSPRVGGKGGNQAIAAARLGADVSMYGAVGSDDYGTELVETAASNGVDVDRVAVIPGRSGIALIAIDSRAENTVIVAPEANGALSYDNVRDLETALTSSAALLAQLEVPVAIVEWAARAAKAQGAKVVLNAAPASAWPTPDLRSLLTLTDVLIVNETEAELMGASGSTLDGAHELRRLGPDVVVITLGARGVIFASPLESGFERGISVDAIDTVGAGDSFCAELTVALLDGDSLHRAVQRANVAGALATTRMGSTESTPSRADVDSRLLQEDGTAHAR